MHTIGYARVSSKEQQLETNALDQQCTRLKKAGADKLFVDVESGYKGKNRKSLNEVMELVRTNKVRRVIITRVDRLSRNTREAFALVEEFLKSNVELQVLDEPIDLTSAAGRLAAGMLIVMAQHHSDQKAESVRHGWNHHRATHKANVELFGYLKVKDKYVLNKQPFLCLLDTKKEYSYSDIGIDIIETFIVEKSLRNCLRVINKKYGYYRFTQGFKGEKSWWINSPFGLSNWFKNPVLRGHTFYKTKDGEILVENTHPDQVLLSPLEYSLIETIISKNKETKGYGAGKQKYPLSGLLYCAVCRNTFYSRNTYQRKKNGEKTIYYQCRYYLLGSCANGKSIRLDKTEEIVFKKLTDHVSYITNELVEDTSKPTIEENPRITELKNQLESLEAIPGNNTAIRQAIDNVKTQIFELKSQESEETVDKNLIREAFLDIFSEPTMFQLLSYEERRELLLRFVEKVVVNDGEVVDIILKF